MKTRVKTHQKKTPYFNNGLEYYGRYQWNVKRYDWENDEDINDAQLNTIQRLKFELNDPRLDISFQGRSGGWLVIDTPLEPMELRRVDVLVEKYLNASIEDIMNESF